MDNNYLKSGTFCLGVNYWASHAGTNMWRDWKIDVIEKDFKELKEKKIKVLRVFPLWCDFQPIDMLLGHAGTPMEIAFGEDFLGNGEEERAGVSSESILKFSKFLDLAAKYELKVIVSLINGWMSGRCFFPPALKGKNVITDPFCVMWEVRYIKYFVKHFRDRSEIIAWEPGNECNCLGKVSSSAEAWNWTNSIVAAIKNVDDTRPVLSGMHSLACGDYWNIEDQAELCDVLTIHPYVLFTPCCDFDGIVSPRAVMHSAAELSLYADIGKKNCLVEEIGSFGSLMGSKKKTADFIRANLFTAWAYNGLGMFWWTAFDQMHLKHAPYEWCDCERELGLFDQNGTAKPIAEEFKKFFDFLQKVPYHSLPVREKNAVCLISPDSWLHAFGSFLCAKRAGFDIEFSSKYKKLPKSNFYIIPGSKSYDFLRKSVCDELFDKVKNGATVLITYDKFVMGGFENFIGCESEGRYKSDFIETELCEKKIKIGSEYKIRLVPKTAETISEDQEKYPAFIKNRYGKGWVIFFNAPIEWYVATASDSLSNGNSVEMVYRYAADIAGIRRIVTSKNPNLDITIHHVDERKSIVIVMNNTISLIEDNLVFTNAKPKKVLYGNIDNNGKIAINAADALVMEVQLIV